MGSRGGGDRNRTGYSLLAKQDRYLSVVPARTQAIPVMVTRLLRMPGFRYEVYVINLHACTRGIARTRRLELLLTGLESVVLPLHQVRSIQL